MNLPEPKRRALVPFPKELRDRILDAYNDDRCEVFVTRQEDLAIRYHAGAIRKVMPTFMGMYLLVVDIEIQ